MHIREIESIYEWNNEIKNKIEWEVESIVSDYDATFKVIKAHHDYELPELIAIPIQSSKGIELWCNPLNRV